MVNILGPLLICISFAVGSYGFLISCHGDRCLDKCLVNCPRHSRVTFFTQYSPCSYGCIVNGQYEYHTEKDFSVCGTNKLCYHGQCLSVTNSTHCRKTYGFNFVGLEDPDNFCQYTCVPRNCKCGTYVESLPSETVCLVGWSNKLGVCRDGVCIAKDKGSHSAHDENIRERPLFGQSIAAGRATPRGFTSTAESIARYEGLNPYNEVSSFIEKQENEYLRGEAQGRQGSEYTNSQVPGQQENAYWKSQTKGGRLGYPQNQAPDFGYPQSRGSTRVTGSSIASSQQGQQDYGNSNESDEYQSRNALHSHQGSSRLQAHQAGASVDEKSQRDSAIHSHQGQGSSMLQAHQAGASVDEKSQRDSAIHSHHVQGSRLAGQRSQSDILSHQAQNSGYQAQNSGYQTQNSGYQAQNSGYQAQKSGYQARQGSQSQESLSKISTQLNQGIDYSKIEAQQAYADAKESHGNQRWASNQNQAYSRLEAEAAYESAQSQHKDSASHSEINIASNALGGSGNVISVSSGAGEKLGNAMSAAVQGSGKVISGAGKVISGTDQMIHGAHLISSSIGSGSIGVNQNSLKNTVVSGEHISAENAAAGKYISSSTGSESYSNSGSRAYSLESSGSKSFSSGGSGFDLNLASAESGLLGSGEYVSSSSGGSGLNLANIQSGSWNTGNSGSLGESKYESSMSSGSSSRQSSSESFSSSSGGSSQASFVSGAVGRDLDLNVSL